jgi:hypothetical protein
MRALSIRQPYAELILRGEKTIEYRSRPTKIIGERFYIYASRKWAGVDLPLPVGEGWGEGAHNGQRANGHAMTAAAALTPDPSPHGRGGYPTGVIVGTAIISHVTNGGTGLTAYEWHLTDVQRLKQPRKPRGQPQPVWFRPF